MKEKLLKLIKKERLMLIGAALGAVAGYLYWFFIGCSSGTCPITSSPINSTLYGIILGALMLSLFKKKEKKQKLQ